MRKIMISEIFGSTSISEYRNVAQKWVEDNCNVQPTCGVGINQIDYADVQILSGDLITIAMDSNSILAINQLAVLLSVCAGNGVQVDLDCGDGLVQSIL